MTRAALLPAGSDPFLLAYWLRNFATWSQYVDELRIAVCGALEPEALAYIKDLVAAVKGATLYHIKDRTAHGQMIGYLLARTTADHIMLCEDDAYVRRPEIVDESFRFAEAGGIVATPRDGYASQEVIDAATERLGSGYAYWPCFLFTARENLDGLNFDGTHWAVGDTLFDHTMAEASLSDTMIEASYRLRALPMPERLIDNHRLSGQPVPDDAPWFHVGSLSSGHGFMFMSAITPEAYQHELGMFARLPEGNALQRIAWWWRAWRSAAGAIPDYHRRYGTGMTDLMRDLGIAKHNVDWYNERADALVTWAER